MGDSLKKRFRGSLVAATILVLALMAVTPARQLYQQNDRIDGARGRLEVLREENARMQGHLDALKDPAYQEKLARRQLDMVRPGEVSYVIVGHEERADPPPRSESPSRLKRFMDWIVERLPGS